MTPTEGQTTAEAIAARHGLIVGQLADIMLGLYPDDPCIREILTVTVANGWFKFTFRKHDEDKCNFGGYTLESLNETQDQNP